MHLAAQQVEILRGRGAVTNLNIVLGAELKKAFNARARVFRSLAFKAVRQQQNQTAGLVPLRFGGDNELVNNDLRAVHEITKLRFPHGQRCGRGHAVAKFKAHDPEFAQRTVDGFKLGLLRIQMFQRKITFAAFVIQKLQMSLGEGAARHVFAAQANRSAFQHQTSKRQSFSKAPVNGRAV